MPNGESSGTDSQVTAVKHKGILRSGNQKLSAQNDPINRPLKSANAQERSKDGLSREGTTETYKKAQFETRLSARSNERSGKSARQREAPKKNSLGEGSVISCANYKCPDTCMNLTLGWKLIRMR